MHTVAIFGVGLIGGSFALALRSAGFKGRILGVSGPQTIEKALELGVIDAAASQEDAAAEADLLYLAQPIRPILELLPALDGCVRPDALITDAGSTKVAIVEKAHTCITRCQFLGGHPLAGKETRGVESAGADLFLGRVYVLTPSSPKEMETPAVSSFTEWLRRFGAHPIVMTANEHDQTVAYTSHLPQLASTALSALLAGRGDLVRTVFGPGLLDSTRLALSSYRIWDDIVETNRGEIESALGEYIRILQTMKANIKAPGLEEYFRQANTLAFSVRRPE